jgi:hypothetical protein
MAKVRGKTKRAAPKRTSKKKQDLSLQVVKLLSSMAILVILVLGVGLLADLYLNRPSGRTSAAIRPSSPPAGPQRQTPPPRKAPAKRPEASAAQPKSRPVYEVPVKDEPPIKPLVPLPQLPGTRKPLVAIIIDDIGYDRPMAEALMGLDVPLTLSMLPHGTFSRAIVNQARAQGLEIMLHLPMEPHEYPDVKPGPGALLSEMEPDALIAQLNEDIDLFPGLKGVNNHMGSRISTSAEQMRQIFTILKKRGLYYIDSRTTASTVAEPSARLLQLPFAERDIFLDHVESEAFVRAQLQRLIQRAQQQGYAIAIGHPHDVTYQVLKEFLPTLTSAVTIVPASMVVNEVMLAAAAKSQATR